MIALLLAGCTSADKAPSDTDTAPEVVDCAGATAEATLADVPTVVRVTWETAEETSGTVVFTTPRGSSATTPTTGTTHEALLVGNPANTEVAWQVRADVDGETKCLAAGTITTGALPSNLPDVTLTGDPARAPAYTIVPIVKAETGFLVILDADGRYVWAWSEVADGKPTTFYGAELSLAGGEILANTTAMSADEPGPIYRIGLDGALREPILPPGGHTDFVQLPDGVVVSLGWAVREIDGRRFLGDTLVEVAADGTSRTVWSVFDDFTPDTNRTYEQGWYPGDPTVEDWSHINGVTWDPVGDDLLVTTTFNQSVLRIDRATGELLWQLSDEGGDFSNPDGDTLVSFPHSVQVVDEGVLVFNRGDIYASGTCSQAVAITLADDTARSTWAYGTEKCLLVAFLGSAHRRADGLTMVDWTTAGQIDAVDGDTSVWRLNLDLGAAFTFADHVDTLYPGG